MKTIINKLLASVTIKSVLLLYGLMFFTNVYGDDSSVVLVTAVESNVKKGRIIEIRRIYLGLPSSSDNLIKQSVHNVSDQEIYKLFIKNVMHMTEKSYQRKIVKRIFRQGSRKLLEINSTDDLVQHLISNPQNVSYMKKDIALKTKGIKIVQVLW